MNEAKNICKRISKKTYANILIQTPKGKKDVIKSIAKDKNMSVRELVVEALWKVYGIDVWG